MSYDSAELRSGIIDLFDEASDRGREWFGRDRFIVERIERAKRLRPRLRPPRRDWPPAPPDFFIVVPGDIDDFIVDSLEDYQRLRKQEIDACRLCDEIAEGIVEPRTAHVSELVRIYRDSAPGDASGVAAAIVAASIMRGELPSERAAAEATLPADEGDDSVEDG